MSSEMARIVEWHNGEKQPGAFSAAEMDRRQKTLRHHMALHEIDACLFTSIHNIGYFSGFIYSAFGRNYGFVVRQDDAVSITAAIDGGQPWRRTHGNNITYTDWQKDNYFHAVRSVTGGVTKLGIEFDHVSIALRAQLEAELPGIELVDVGVDTMWMRTIKSNEEIEHIKVATSIADLGGEACREAIGAGVPEHEVALASTGAMVRAITNRFDFVELMDTWTWFQSGINTDGAHNPVTNKRIDPGDILSINCFPMIMGYYVALERTLFCESATAEELRLWNINVEVHEAGLELIKPGAYCSDIAAALNEIYQGYDLLKYRSFGYGHSFGVLSHYYGREAGVELREDVRTELQPGMVVSMEPMIMVPEAIPGAGGYREHDVLVIHHDGSVENITGFPYGPEHNIVAAK